jgi:hypothetical protein
MKNIDIRDAFLLVGLAALCLGTGAFDWRAGCIVGGAVLLAAWFRGGGN